MKAILVFVLAALLLLLLSKREGFKNVAFNAENQIRKITNRVLPTNALCIQGSQCVSGVCLDSANGALYGYCK